MARLWAVLAPVLVLGCGTLDTIDNVHDLRILGVQADPPDQALTLEGTSLVGAISPVQITALIADPNGNGRTITYSFAVCAQLDSIATETAPTHRCQSTDYQEFASGTAVATNGWVELTGSFTATVPLLTDTFELDMYHGLDGLRLPVQITVSAGNESVVGTKLVVFTLTHGNAYTPNVNPVLQGVAVEGQPWAEGTPMTFSYASEPNSNGWRIQPQFDASLEETYQEPSFTGQLLPFQEHWLFDYFSTCDGFTPTTAGTEGLATSQASSPNTYWLPPKTASNPITFWLVVRDGRGGETWLTRQAVVTP